MNGHNYHVQVVWLQNNWTGLKINLDIKCIYLHGLAFIRNEESE